MSIVAPIKAIAGSLSQVMGSLDGLITSKEERMSKDNELAEIRNELAGIQRDMYEKAAEVELNLIEKKSEILKNETSGNRLQRNWRPILMLVFGGIIVYQYFLVQAVNAVLIMFTVEYQGDLLSIPQFILPDRFWTLLEIGVGGYIAGRSLEKIVPNVSQKIMDAKETRRFTEELQIKQSERTKRLEIREDRRNRRNERREDRQTRRDEKREERIENRIDIAESIVVNDETEGQKLTKKQIRQNRRKERRMRGQKLIQKIKNQQ